MGHNSGLTHIFGRFGIVSLHKYKYVILDRFQRNLLGPSGPSKKWPRMTTNPVQAGIMEKRPFLRSAAKKIFGPKMHQFFWPKKHQKFLKRLIFILEGIFFFAKLFPVVTRTWCPLRRVLIFFGLKSGFLAYVRKLCCNFCTIQSALWQHKLERMFKSRNISNRG